MALKDKILKQFTSNPGVFYSGEDLAETHQVTRAAVWKAIRQLKDAGYRIDSVLGKGYCFTNENEPLNAEVIRSCAEYEIPLILLDTVDSTNNYAKKLVIDGCEDGTFIIANQQTKGRGRKGHSFYSPSNTGLYMTYIEKKERSLQELSQTTLAAAVACIEAIRFCSEAPVEIKWFNDIYLNGQKIAGILTEAMSDADTLQTEAVIIGVGINWRTTEFPEELKNKASSLQGTSSSRNQLAGVFYAKLREWLNRDAETVMEKYRSFSAVLHKKIVYEKDGQRMTGYVEDILNSGIIVISDDSSTSIYNVKEIHLLEW